MKGRRIAVFGLSLAVSLAQASGVFALSVTQTTNTTTLGTALGGGGLTINSVTIDNGNTAQFGTYTGFTSAPVTIGNGVVLSSGQVTQTTSAFVSAGNTPSTDFGVAGTTAFNTYGPGNIDNFSGSHDVASLTVNFTLGSASQVGFDFVFGSVEYPDFTSNFTDAFLAFVDGTGPANQIVFDASGNPVQVGNTFASALTTADTNTAFAGVHGLMKLQTFTLNPLAAGAHTITFQVGDVNDGILDSAVFLSNFHAGTGPGGTKPPGPPTGNVPEPASLLLLGAGLVGVGAARFKHQA